MSRVSRLHPPSDQAKVAPLDAQGALAAIRALLSSLSPQERDKVIRELGEVARELPAPHAGQVLGAVIAFLPQKEKWTAEEIKQKIAASGVDATPKEVYNAIGYCTRRQYLHRVGYGEYRVDGTIITSAIDFGAGTVRNSEHYD